MPNIDLLNPFIRKQVLADIRSQENVNRKRESLKDFEIYQDRIKAYVYEDLVCQLGKSTADQMPIISSMNVGKFVVDNEATIYTSDPDREIDNATDDDVMAVDKLYKEKQFNSKLQKANKWFKYRDQAFIQVIPKPDDGCVDLRVLLAHHIDVIPDAVDPEKPYAYIMSAFDKNNWLRAGNDHINQITADTEDYKQALEKYVVWTSEYNFIMNGKGELITEIVPNELQELPFIDISKDKDFEFFVRPGGCLSDFTVQYNMTWTDVSYINRMQGFSVGVLKGDPSLKPDSMTIGPAKLLFLPINPENPTAALDLDFKSPDPKVEGSLKMIHQMLADFLMTRGLDTKKVSSALAGTGASYSSAIERLLAQVEEFKATKEDFDLFRMVEKKVFKLVKKYLVLLSQANLLQDEYRVSPSFINAELDVCFESPEMIQTEAEELLDAKSKIDLGIADRVSILMDLYDYDEEKALEYIKKIDQRKDERLGLLISANQKPQGNQVGS